jgi:predicted lipoprotein with Yx(FWY)xxD motif
MNSLKTVGKTVRIARLLAALLLASILSVSHARAPMAWADVTSQSVASVTSVAQTCGGLPAPGIYTGATLIGSTVVPTYIPLSTSCAYYPSGSMPAPTTNYSNSFSTTAVQNCTVSTTPGIAVGATLVGTTVEPTYIGNPVLCLGAKAPGSSSGEYCAMGAERIWVPTGGPTDGLTCPAPSASASSLPSSTTVPASSATSSLPSSGGQASTTVTLAQNPTLGPVLTDSHGVTLYIFTLDKPGVSNCSGDCASVWPPFQPPSTTLVAPAGANGTLGVITRADGTQQVTYNEMPLYYYVADKNPGDTKGQGIAPPAPAAYGGAWYVVTP